MLLLARTDSGALDALYHYAAADFDYDMAFGGLEVVKVSCEVLFLAGTVSRSLDAFDFYTAANFDSFLPASLNLIFEQYERTT